MTFMTRFIPATSLNVTKTNLNVLPGSVGDTACELDEQTTSPSSKPSRRPSSPIATTPASTTFKARYIPEIFSKETNVVKP